MACHARHATARYCTLKTGGPKKWLISTWRYFQILIFPQFSLSSLTKSEIVVAGVTLPFSNLVRLSLVPVIIPVIISLSHAAKSNVTNLGQLASLTPFSEISSSPATLTVSGRTKTVSWSWKAKFLTVLANMTLLALAVSLVTMDKLYADYQFTTGAHFFILWPYNTSWWHREHTSTD